MSARFEIVRTDAGHHARFVAANGQTVWTTESYTRKGAALNAVASLIDPLNCGWIEKDWYYSVNPLVTGPAVVYRRDSWEKKNGLRIEIRMVDERTAS